MGNLPHYRKSSIPQNAKKVFEGVIFDVYQWDQKLYDGSTSIFEKLARPDTAIVFPILEDGRILLINDEQPDKTYSYVAPSGRVEEGETPEETARRELKEETGYEVGELIPFYTHKPASKIDWYIYAFIGTGCKKVGEPMLDSGERITPVPVTFDELLEKAASSEEVYHYGHFTKLALEALDNPNKRASLKAQFGL